jgi:hypothetical protein
MLKNRIILCSLIAAILSVTFVTNGVAQVMPDASTALSNVKPSFLENRGQWDAHAKYLLRAGGVDLWVTDRGVVYDLHKETHSNSKATDAFEPMTPQSLRENQEKVMRTGHAVEMQFEHMLTAEPETLNVLPGTSNYFIGNDSSKWVTGARTYSGVTMKHIYPGVDVRFYLDHGVPRYDLIVQPGADPKSIKMKFAGQTGMTADANGNLLIETSMGNIEERGLFAYQMVGGSKQQIACSFKVAGSGRVTFDVGAFDRSQPLTIDPLVYSTYLGGTLDEQGTGIAVDVSGFAYVTGFTASANFPATPGAYQTTFVGVGHDAFVTKLSVDGASRVYSTYLGGSDVEDANGIVINESGNAYVTGYTRSTNFPTTRGAYQTTNAGTADAFVTKLSADGTSPVYSTFLGGSDRENGFGIAVDGSFHAYVTGFTGSTNFPATIGAYETASGGRADAFVTKLSVDGASLVYSTYLGGSSYTTGLGIAVDGSGFAYVTGSTLSTDFPTTPGAYQTTFGGLTDAFVTKFSVDGGSRVYSTYLGGSSDDQGLGIAVDGSGHACVAGFTNSTNFPATTGGYQTTNGGRYDAFVAKLSVDGASRVYATYLGGSSNDAGYGIALDGSGYAYVTGTTSSTDFPATTGAYQTAHGGSAANDDAFITKLSPNGSGSGVAAQADVPPAGLTLRQNAPNPFSDRTTIEYPLPASALVTLNVYNALGQTITTLVNAREDAGIHSVAFDASHLIQWDIFLSARGWKRVGCREDVFI